MAGCDTLLIPRSYNDKTTNDKMDYYLEGAEAAATLAESWAIGGTDSRDGEDTDNAKYYAELAQSYAEEAAEGNSSTSSNVEAASEYAEAASASAEAAAASESNADEYATLSQSYAVGGTGTRTGEDADNSKYYAEQAAASATSAEEDAATAANKAQSAADYAALSESWAVGGTGTSLRDDDDDEDTNNAKYYAEQSASSVTEATSQAEAASASADAAATSADEASASATLAESWAVGGTDTRDGEDEDNAKYYAEQSAAAAAEVVSDLDSRITAIEEGGYGADLHTSVGAENNPVYFDDTGQAVKCISDEYYNTFLGIDAGATLISSIEEYLDDETSVYYCRYNTAVGYQALTANTTGYNSVAVGYQALYNNTTGSISVAVGYRALYNNTTGLWNVAVGTSAGGSITTGSSNVCLGRGARVLPEDSCQIRIGNWVGSIIHHYFDTTATQDDVYTWANTICPYAQTGCFGFFGTGNSLARMVVNSGTSVVFYNCDNTAVLTCTSGSDSTIGSWLSVTCAVNDIYYSD